MSAGTPGADPEVVIPAGAAELPGRLGVPDDPVGVVVLAHRAGHGLRDRRVAALLRRAGLGTLLVDPLTGEEATRGRNVFDIGLLADRMITAVEWLRPRREAKGKPIGLLAAGTDAAAALWAAAEPGSGIAAVVCQSGRPDLAGRALDRLVAPTLLVVGGRDAGLLAVNEAAVRRLRCPTRLAVLPGGLAEPRALSTVAALAGGWFVKHLGAQADRWRGSAPAAR